MFLFREIHFLQDFFLSEIYKNIYKNMISANRSRAKNTIQDVDNIGIKLCWNKDFKNILDLMLYRTIEPS